MLRVFQISTELNSGSVGRIAEQIGEAVIAEGWESYIAFARDNQPSKSKSIKIGAKMDLIKHGVLTRFTDRHGFGSASATKNLIKKIEEIKPDIIHLQHLHGYYINIEILFSYLSEKKIPVVWTFHDCWSFTGHCAYYEYIDCQKWQEQCFKCPQTNEYPKSYIDQSKKNYNDKKRIFNSHPNLTIVPVSKWLGEETRKSFLKNHSVKVIQNGIDLEKFKIAENISEVRNRLNLRNEFLILGVASPFNKRKGFKYFIELSEMLSDHYKIVMVGLDKSQIKSLPESIIGIERTESIDELAELYSAADVFFNPTLEDTFPTTNLEAQACGTPVVTFRSGGSPETIDTSTGFVIDKGDLQAAIYCFEKIKKNGGTFYKENCRERAVQLFNKNLNYKNYINIYKDLLEKNKET